MFFCPSDEIWIFITSKEMRHFYTFLYICLIVFPKSFFPIVYRQYIFFNFFHIYFTNEEMLTFHTSGEISVFVIVLKKYEFLYQWRYISIYIHMGFLLVIEKCGYFFTSEETTNKYEFSSYCFSIIITSLFPFRFVLDSPTWRFYWSKRICHIWKMRLSNVLNFSNLMYIARVNELCQRKRARSVKHLFFYSQCWRRKHGQRKKMFCGCWQMFLPTASVFYIFICIFIIFV